MLLLYLPHWPLLWTLPRIFFLQTPTDLPMSVPLVLHKCHLCREKFLDHPIWSRTSVTLCPYTVVVFFFPLKHLYLTVYFKCIGSFYFLARSCHFNHSLTHWPELSITLFSGHMDSPRSLPSTRPLSLWKGMSHCSPAAICYLLSCPFNLLNLRLRVSSPRPHIRACGLSSAVHNVSVYGVKYSNMNTISL